MAVFEKQSIVKTSGVSDQSDVNLFWITNTITTNFFDGTRLKQ